MDAVDHVNLGQFQDFARYVQSWPEFKIYNLKEIIEDPSCPVHDVEVASKYLNLMQSKRILHVKSLYAKGKVYRRGCTPTEAEEIKRQGLAGWTGALVTEFLERHPCIGEFTLKRIYRSTEYGEPILPVLSASAPEEEGASEEAEPEPTSLETPPAIF
ncbi:hypothetical protein ES703_00809 [subsurface metagenome]